MIRSFSVEEINQLLGEINKYKVAERPFDRQLLKRIDQFISPQNTPRLVNENIEDYLESIFGWPRYSLFTYGTLMPGESNHQVLAPLTGVWKPGWVKGHLYELGWGADKGFPAMKWDPEGEEIPGQLLISKQLDWELMDGFEGRQYQRVWVPVLEKGNILAVSNAYEGVTR